MGFTLPVKALRFGLQAKDDLIFVGCHRWPRLARWFFRRHWDSAVGSRFVEEHFSPRYDPWDQRICVAVGLKDKLRSGEVSIKTGEIDHFTGSSIVLTNGEHLKCDVCVLATGFDMRFLKFDLYVGDRKISFGGLNFYKGLMLGAVPNYFHPAGVWHSAWTQRSETASRFAIRIMAYMQQHGLRTVSIDRREVDAVPAITPNYVKRSLASIPKMYGTFELPSVDTVLSYRFDPRSFNFT